MVLQNSGTPLLCSQIQTEFGGTNPISMSEYWSDSSTGYTSNTTIPISSNAIKFSDFYGKRKTTRVALNFITPRTDVITSNFGNVYTLYTFYTSGTDKTSNNFKININCTAQVYAIGAGGDGGNWSGGRVPYSGGGGGAGAIRSSNIAFNTTTTYNTYASTNNSATRFSYLNGTKYLNFLVAIQGGKGGNGYWSGEEGACGGGAGYSSGTIYTYAGYPVNSKVDSYGITYTNLGTQVGSQTNGGDKSLLGYNGGGGGGAGSAGGIGGTPGNAFTVNYNGYKVGTFCKGGPGDSIVTAVNYGDGGSDYGGKGKCGAIIIILPTYIYN